MLAVGGGRARAFTADTYAASSRLAQGRWVKIRVSDSGMYLITPAMLRQWGFTQPDRCRVYGYGGAPQSDVLEAATYVDDVPMAMCEYTTQGLVFYGQGPRQETASVSGFWTYATNYYSNHGYYFVGEATDEEIDRALPASGAGPFEHGNVPSDFTEIAWYERELISPGATGHRFLGEDFRNTRRQTFRLSTPGRIDGLGQVALRCGFGVKANSTSSLSFAVDGEEMPAVSRLASTSDDAGLHYEYNELTTEKVLDGGGATATVDVAYSTSASLLRLARLDYLALNYPRSLTLTGAQLTFRSFDRSAFVLSGASADTRIWNLGEGSRIEAQPDASGMVGWEYGAAAPRRFVAWRPSASLPAPEYVGVVTNQDLHSRSVPDMVIITLPQWYAQAEALAELHRKDADGPLDVAVVTADQAYNEFSSGTPDVGAFRRMLKMWWDRGGGSSSTASSLRYALMFGRGFYDHRAVSDEGRMMAGTLLPQWQTIDGGSDNTSYTTEDFLAFLRDGSGATPGTDYHCIAVGRIPVKSESEGAVTVEKIQAYMADANPSDWKNRVVLATDDEDAGEHLKQMELAYNSLMSSRGGEQYVYHKIYVDAFPLIDGKSKDAHDRMFRILNQGALWWWYIGHATSTSWTGEDLLTLRDVNDSRFRYQPMLYAATCSFLRWDNVAESGAETLFFNPDGIIGAIAATRPVWISENRQMSLRMAAVVGDNAAVDGRMPVGELLRQAKNGLLVHSDRENKLRYVLLGDPAMRLSTARRGVEVDAMASQPMDAEDYPEIMARQRFTIEGRVVDAGGETDASFSGTVVPTVYDAEFSTVSLGHGKYGEEIAFEEMGDRLYVGRGKVEGGHFSVEVSMPSEISSNYRPATLNVYAFTPDGTDAVGVSRRFYVYGYDDDAPADDTPPVIETLALNSETFASGDVVNASPMLIARVSDDVGINISTAGVGHQISVVIDGTDTYPDVTQYYTPGDDGARSGSVYYQLSDLAEGRHSLRFRVWDTANNLAEQTLEFVVSSRQAPTIVDLYTDANPARDHANFYVRHNRPDAVVDVAVTVYDLMGRTVWTGSRRGRSDLFVSSPLPWDLTDGAGRRVGRGIYIYRAVVKDDTGEHASAVRRIAVAVP